jgi:ABC-type phosphate transport system ATPase subunit
MQCCGSQTHAALEDGSDMTLQVPGMSLLLGGRRTRLRLARLLEIGHSILLSYMYAMTRPAMGLASCATNHKSHAAHERI